MLRFQAMVVIAVCLLTCTSPLIAQSPDSPITKPFGVSQDNLNTIAKSEEKEGFANIYPPKPHPVFEKYSIKTVGKTLCEVSGYAPLSGKTASRANLLRVRSELIELVGEPSAERSGRSFVQDEKSISIWTANREVSVTLQEFQYLDKLAILVKFSFEKPGCASGKQPNGFR